MMSESTIMSFPELTEGKLIKRYKRFLAEIELNNGQIVTAHCTNTGPMRGILHPGGKVRIRFSPSPKRKLSWTWEQAETKNSNGTSCWVGVNTHLANHLVKKAIELGFLKKKLGLIKNIRAEVTYGVNRKSRIDLFLRPDETNIDQRPIYLEVKNTTWAQGDIALFPDTVTKRGQKHLLELVSVLKDSRAVLVPCISRADVQNFEPGEEVDPLYGKLFYQAMKSGVEIIPCSFGFRKDQITWEGLRSLVNKSAIEN